MTGFVAPHVLTCTKNVSRGFSVSCCLSSSENPSVKPPTSLESTVTLATSALNKAIEDGNKRLLVTALIPGLNPLIEQTVPLSSSLLQILAKSLVTHTSSLNSNSSALLFSSSGFAAAAAAQILRERQDVRLVSNEENSTSDNQPPKITTASFARRDIIDGRTSPNCNVIVNPISSRGDPVMDDLETILSENEQATWLLLNPDLGVDRAAVGMHENTRRSTFLQSFVNTFYFRNLFEIQRPILKPIERGALLYCYGQRWQVFALIEEEYVLVDELDHMPDPNKITAMINFACAKARKERSPKPRAGFDVEIRRLFGFK